MKQFYSISEVAKILGIKFYKIAYAHSAGLVPEPDRIMNKRVYQELDILKLARHFEVNEDDVKLKMK